MKKYFKLYNDNRSEYNSTIFDLISGDKETKQTKGLAYVLSQYPDFLLMFTSLLPVEKEILKKTGFKLKPGMISSIEVSAERYTSDSKRADIIIKFDSKIEPLLAIIIEAKSIKVNTNQESLSNQIKEYLQDDMFPELINYPKVGVALTKYSQNIPEIANLSWNNIVEIMQEYSNKLNENSILTQFLNFITQINKSMNYYEKEVLSIPAGKSLDLVEKHKIYVCPDTRSYNYKKPIFVGFRKSNGGIMEKLYKIEDIIVINPSKKNELETFRNSAYDDKFKERILNYISEVDYTSIIDHDERFYILSEHEVIDLKNSPKPKRNNAKFTYYTLAEVLTKKIITPSSQK